MPLGTVLNTAVERRFDLFLGFRVPEGDFPGFAGLVHIDDALVRRAAKAQGNVFEFIDECAVDEHVGPHEPSVTPHFGALQQSLHLRT